MTQCNVRVAQVSTGGLATFANIEPKTFDQNADLLTMSVKPLQLNDGESTMVQDIVRGLSNADGTTIRETLRTLLAAFDGAMKPGVQSECDKIAFETLVTALLFGRGQITPKSAGR